MSDWPKLVLVIGGIALFGGVLLLSIFTYYMAGASRNSSLAIGALFGSSLLLLIQLLFDLQGSRASEFISTEFTLDVSKPSLHQWYYPVSQGERFGNEVKASQDLAGTEPEKFTGDRTEQERLVRDMTLYSVISYIRTKQHDWQTVRRRAKRGDGGSVEFFTWTSGPADCALISDDEIRQMLRKVKNSFAETKWHPDGFTHSTCLPPKTTMRIDAQSVTLKNPFCQIVFRVKPTFATYYLPPQAAMTELQSRGITKTTLPDGTARFVTFDGGFEVDAKYAALRAQHREQPKYATWVRQMIDGARDWFEKRPEEGENRLGGLNVQSN
jgi:hypothetical protein